MSQKSFIPEEPVRSLEIGCIVQVVNHYTENMTLKPAESYVTLRCHPREMSDGDVVLGRFYVGQIGIVLEIDHRYDMVKVMSLTHVGWTRKKKVAKVMNHEKN